MAYKIHTSNSVSTICTSGTMSQEERRAMLQDIIGILESTGQRAIVIDHTMTKLDCSLEDAHQFGKEIGTALARYPEVSIAVLSPGEDPTLKCIDLSVMVAQSKGVKIASFTDPDLLMEHTALRMASPLFC